MASDDLSGRRVRFTIDGLGALSKDGQGGMAAKAYGKDDGGTVLFQLTLSDRDGESWWAVEPDDDPTLYVPVRPNMIEEVPS